MVTTAIYTRLPFGIASGPEMYQRSQRELLVGLHEVINMPTISVSLDVHGKFEKGS